MLLNREIRKSSIAGDTKFGFFQRMRLFGDHLHDFLGSDLVDRSFHIVGRQLETGLDPHLMLDFRE